jgi:hypothetical protein
MSLSLVFVCALCAAATVRPAAAAGPGKWQPVTRLRGSLADLTGKVNELAAPMGKVTPANASFADLAARKDPLLEIPFIDVGAIVKAKGATAFVGRHQVGDGFDFAQVRFTGDVEISTRAAALVIGTVAGATDVVAANGQKQRIAVISARIVGVIDDGGMQPNGLLIFSPQSPIRIYQLKAKGKKKAAK